VGRRYIHPSATNQSRVELNSVQVRLRSSLPPPCRDLISELFSFHPQMDVILFFHTDRPGQHEFFLNQSRVVFAVGEETTLSRNYFCPSVFFTREQFVRTIFTKANLLIQFLIIFIEDPILSANSVRISQWSKPWEAPQQSVDAMPYEVLALTGRPCTEIGNVTF